jgi:hypothetical protein
LAVDFDCGDLRWKFVFLFLFFITIGIWKVEIVLFDKVFFFFFWVKSVKLGKLKSGALRVGTQAPVQLGSLRAADGKE